MKRRGFLALLGLAPAAPIVAKELLEKPPVPEWYKNATPGQWYWIPGWGGGHVDVEVRESPGADKNSDS